MKEFDEMLDSVAVWFTCYTLAYGVFAESSDQAFIYGLRAAIVLLLYARARYG